MLVIAQRHFIPDDKFKLLNESCLMLNLAFSAGRTYLVGSALKHENFRDVDVRTLVPNKPTEGLATLLKTTVSMWLSHRTGLHVDFKLQTEANVSQDYAYEWHYPLGRSIAAGVHERCWPMHPDPLQIADQAIMASIFIFNFSRGLTISIEHFNVPDLAQLGSGDQQRVLKEHGVDVRRAGRPTFLFAVALLEPCVLDHIAHRLFSHILIHDAPAPVGGMGM